jgi:rhamnosyltransferase subunit B
VGDGVSRPPRVVLAPYGSSGDLAPFLALGSDLSRRGIEVAVAVDPVHSRAVAHAGLAAHPLPCPQREALGARAVALPQASADEFVATLVDHHLVPALRTVEASLREACAGADVVVAAPLQLAAPVAAEALGVTWLTLTTTPLSVASSALRPEGRALAAELRGRADAAVEALRREHGLEPRSDVLGAGGLSETATAVTVSPAFLPRPPDWPPWARLTGFVFDDDDAREAELPEPLRRLLAGGAPVIAVCAGSMAPAMLAELMPYYRAAVAAVHAAGARPLLLGTGLPNGPVEGGLALAWAPLGAVLPRCAAIVHHGGTGTTALALRAGVPAVVVPWARWGADRQLNGERVEALGVGRMVPGDRFDARSATAALRAVLGAAGAAQTVAASLAAEDGLGELRRTVLAPLGVRRDAA